MWYNKTVPNSIDLISFCIRFCFKNIFLIYYIWFVDTDMAAHFEQKKGNVKS